MAIEWYYPNDNGNVAIGIDWNASYSSTSVSIAPVIYRWDGTSTDNYGAYWWETLSPDPSGSGSWSGMSWGSGSGEREIDSFVTRTYSKTTSTQYIELTIGWDAQFGTYYSGSFHYLGSGSHTWSLEIPSLNSYTIYYNPNGGSGPAITQTKQNNVSITLLADIYMQRGHKLLGWSTSSSATSASYALGATYTVNASLTLYAVWQKLKTCTIKYNANGGSGAPSNQTHTENSVSRISKTVPTKSGYAFLGWATTSTATTPQYYVNSEYINNSFTSGTTITLYAVYVKSYAVKINSSTNTVTRVTVKIPDNRSLSRIYFKES